MGRPRDRAPHPRPRSAASVRCGHPAPDGVARPVGHQHSSRVRRRRHGLRQPRAGLRGARVPRHVAARHHVGARGAQLAQSAELGHRGSAPAVSRPSGPRREDRRLRPDRAGGGKRRAGDPVGCREAGRLLGADGGEDLDLAGRRGGSLPRLRLERPREEAAARRLGDQRIHRRAGVPRLLQRGARGKMGHSGREHRVLQAG